MGDTGRRYQSLEQPSRLATNTLAFGRTSFAFYTPSLFRLFCPSSDPRFTLTCLLSPPSPFCFLLGPGERPLISPMPGTTMAADDDGTGHPALVVMARSMFMSLLYSCHQKRRTCLTAPNVLIFLFIFIGLQTLAFLFFFFCAGLRVGGIWGALAEWQLGGSLFPWLGPSYGAELSGLDRWGGAARVQAAGNVCTWLTWSPRMRRDRTGWDGWWHCACPRGIASHRVKVLAIPTSCSSAVCLSQAVVSRATFPRLLFLGLLSLLFTRPLSPPLAAAVLYLGWRTTEQGRCPY